MMLQSYNSQVINIKVAPDDIAFEASSRAYSMHFSAVVLLEHLPRRCLNDKSSRSGTHSFGQKKKDIIHGKILYVAIVENRK